MQTSRLLKFILAFLFIPAIITAQQTRNCGTMQHLDEMLQKDPNMHMRMQNIERQAATYLRTNGTNQGQAVKTIPVVVHIVYNLSSQNLSDAQVQSQIDVLTEDFRRTNADASNTPSYFSSIAADAEIEFCLAVRDPNGNVTTGITRTQTSSSSFSTNNYVKYNAYGGKNAWPASDYLNLWVCNMSGNILGYAQFPGGSSATDGVVIDYAYFGSGGSAQYPFDKGRTATHEVGHWLNLRHIWGDATCGNDYVSDTPTQRTDNGGCPGFPSPTCSNYSDMFMNYMDYTYDACMNAFSAGQASRMNALFGSGGFRESILSSQGCVPVGTVSPYCSSTGNNSSYEWIASVSVGTINNATGSDGGYADFTSISTDLEQGTSYSIDLAPGFSGSTYNEYWKVWIDYNQDGDFADAGELVYDAGALSSAAVSGTITVSSTSSLGETRMRVSMKYNGAQSACESFTYGEVEDYTVNILYPCPSPTGLSATLITETSVSLNWTSTGVPSYDVRIKAVSGSSWSEFTTSNTSLSVTGLTASTDYEFQVKSACSESNLSGFSSSVTFTSAASTSATYCASQGNDATYEWIANVTVGGIDNTSGANGGYNDFSNISTEVEQGDVYSVSLSPGFASSTYNEYWKIWIDWNQDGDFTDSGELAFDAGTASSAVVTGSITIPTTAALGATRMRVSMKWNGASTSCESFNYGEVEDYEVVIIQPVVVLTYCSSLGSDASYEWIAGVSIGTINNTTGTDGGYGDYTSLVTVMDVNLTYNLSLTPGFASTTYSEYWKIWVDLNQDGDFDDTGELVYDAGGLSSAAVSGSINLPNTAMNGTTRMRVSMKYNGAQTSCETFNYGEIEDYTVDIVGGSGNKTTGMAEEEKPVSTMLIYPNPAISSVSIDFASNTEIHDARLTIMNAQGLIVLDEAIEGGYRYTGQYAVDHLAAGTYFVRILNGGDQMVKRLVIIK